MYVYRSLIGVPLKSLGATRLLIFVGQEAAEGVACMHKGVYYVSSRRLKPVLFCWQYKELDLTLLN